MDAKRSAECIGAPLQERPAKMMCNVEVQNVVFELTVALAASGDTLAKLKIPSESSIADLKAALKEHLQQGQLADKLLRGETVLQEEQSLINSGLTDGAEVKVVVGSIPTLYVNDPDDELALVGSDDECFSDEECEDNEAKGLDIEEAPEGVREVAMAMLKAAPSLGQISVAGGETDSPGKIAVIANPGDDPCKACFEALKTPVMTDCCFEQLTGYGKLYFMDKENNRAFHDREKALMFSQAKAKAVNWGQYLKCGFNGQADEEGDENPELIAITKVMNEKLERHFVFTYSDAVVVAPNFYGGYASDGNIVGVLSSRVFT